MTKEREVRLLETSEAGHFYVGQPIRFSMWRGQLVRERWYHRFALWRMRRRLMWWQYPPSIVSRIDLDLGVITMTTMRWSWRRWKWVRA